MNFLDQLKDDLNNPQKRMGTHNRVMVSAGALRELIGYFEKMDSVERVEHRSFPREPMRKRLHDLLQCLYLNMDSDALMFMIMDFLSKKIKEKAQEQMVMSQFELKFPKDKHEF